MLRYPAVGLVFVILYFGGICASGWSAALAEENGKPPVVARLLSAEKIWGHAPHNAFTDLIRFRNRFYCAFREGKAHAGDRGKIRVLLSQHGREWKSTGLLGMEDYDLRDAHLSITPEGRLMLLGGVRQKRGDQWFSGSFACFSKDGQTWTTPRIVVEPGRWLWQVTWHEGKAYGVTYATPKGRPFSSLLVSRDGIQYDDLAPQLLGEGGWPTEATLRFDDDGVCYCLHRRDGQGNTAYFGKAKPPYKQWQWTDLGRRLGGPNFIKIPGGQWLAAGRLYDGAQRTELLHLDVKQGTMTPILRLPSGGDTSYPGLVWHDGVLWMSYYSSHEDRTSIYLAKIAIEHEGDTK